MTSLDELKRRFTGTDFLTFSEKAPGFIAIEVKTAFSTATIALQGAHVMTWQPNGQKPVIWLSSKAKFAAGKSIRGGVPICWPWFGPHAKEASYPGHGFARTIPWTLLDACRLPDGRVRLEFKPEMSDAALAQWPHASTVRYNVTVGQELVVALVTRNTGSVPFQLGQALHTYFTVGDIRQTSIAGLAGCTFIDKVSRRQAQETKGCSDFQRRSGPRLSRHQRLLRNHRSGVEAHHSHHQHRQSFHCRVESRRGEGGKNGRLRPARRNPDGLRRKRECGRRCHHPRTGRNAPHDRAVPRHQGMSEDQ